MSSITSIGKGWPTSTKIIMTSLPPSKRTYPSSIKTSGVHTQMTRRSLNWFPASSTPMEPNYHPIYGFSKAFAGNSIPKSAYCWMLGPSHLPRASSSSLKHLKTRTSEESQALWVSMPTSSLRRVTKKKPRIAWEIVSFRWKRLNNSNTSFLTS